MKLSPITLTQEKLIENFTYWKGLNKVEPPKELLEIFTEKLFTTHSFPFEKETPEGNIIPYESIFSDSPNNGLLSNGYRKSVNINPDDDKSSRNFPAGLENYVFSYLGIHQPYYAKKNQGELGIHRKPLGVFLKHGKLSDKIEVFPHNHASRRDLGKDNEEVDQKNTNLEYLVPENARELMAYQVCNDPAHKVGNDITECFWHYYGNDTLWKNYEYATNSWKKKAEFRFFEKVAIDDIAAILWPLWIDGNEAGAPTYSRTFDDFKVYSSRFKDIKFITYNLDLRKPELSFIKASAVTMEYFLKKGVFPENTNLAADELKN